MCRLLPLETKVLGRPNQPIAECALPDAVDQDASRQRVSPRGQPAGQAQPISRGSFGECPHHGQYPRLEHITLGTIVFAPFQDLRDPRLGQITSHQGGRESLLDLRDPLDQFSCLLMEFQFGKRPLGIS